MKSKFYNKNGDLSLYSLNCGYVQRARTEKKQVDLFKEHCMFHVKTYDIYSTPGRVGCLGIVDNEELTLNNWGTFDKLTDAREMYEKELRQKNE